jgi:DNA-binding NtrC family response regulator
MEGCSVKVYKILIIEDDATFKTALFRLLTREGFQVVTATKLQEAQSLLQSNSKWDHVILDLQLPDGDTSELISQFKQKNPETKVTVITGFGSISKAVEATQKGADQFLTKPLELSQILSAIKKHSSEQSQFPILTKTNLTHNIIGQSESIQQILELTEKVSQSDSTILITGESGTGKELVAKAIHNNSNRRNHPFVAINCGAIPMELLESELFGHTKGAFTGAISNKMGRFEMAEGGTIFLDEIGDMHPSLQVKLLRVLQSKSFEPIGSTKTVHINVRVIAATHVNLEKAVSDSKFREDLYYRLNVIPIHIPPLRERNSDIPILLSHFLSAFEKNSKHTIEGFSENAINFLINYNWPGNIRELENLVERLTILNGHGIIDVEDLPQKYRSHKSQNSLDSKTQSAILCENLDFNSAVDQYENQLILKALEKTGWNRNQAAILLRLNRTTLVEKIKKKGLRPPHDDMEII